MHLQFSSLFASADVSKCKIRLQCHKRITFQGCTLHWSCKFLIAKLKRSWQYWHSSFVEVVKTLVEYFAINTKLPMLAMLTSMVFITAIMLPPVGLDLMITVSRIYNVYPTELTLHVLVSLTLEVTFLQL